MKVANTWELVYLILVYFIIFLEVIIVFGAIKATMELLDRGHHYIRCMVLIMALLMIS
jgi:hypothetical protein